jgi:hypothetical protein
MFCSIQTHRHIGMSTIGVKRQLVEIANLLHQWTTIWQTK